MRGLPDQYQYQSDYSSSHEINGKVCQERRKIYREAAHVHPDKSQERKEQVAAWIEYGIGDSAKKLDKRVGPVDRYPRE